MLVLSTKKKEGRGCKRNPLLNTSFYFNIRIETMISLPLLPQSPMNVVFRPWFLSRSSFVPYFQRIVRNTYLHGHNPSTCNPLLILLISFHSYLSCLLVNSKQFLWKIIHPWPKTPDNSSNVYFSVLNL